MMIGAAEELLPFDAARTPEWYELRRQGVTASEIAAILGLSKWSSPLALYYRKRGELDDEGDNYRMDLGRALEPYIIECFEAMTGLETTQCGLVRSVKRPWQMASPDAVVGNIPVECKSAHSDEFWGPAGSSVVPLYYRAQLMWQMDVLGADHGYMAVVFLRSGEPRWYQVSWDSDDVGVMRMMAWSFLEQVERGEAPYTDGSEASERALKHVFRPDQGVPDAVCSPTLLDSFRAALRARRDIDDQYQLAINEVRQAMGNSARLVGPGGEIVAVKRGAKGALYPGKGLLDD